MPPDRSILTRLTRADLKRTRIPLIDALVAFVPEGQTPAPPVQQQLDTRGYQRWYPTAGGHLIKTPYQGGPVPMEHFRVEPGGWDHDHCDACVTSMKAGTDCWATRETNFKLICDACFNELK